MWHRDLRHDIRARCAEKEV